MRTDTARAATLADEFTELRLPGSPGQARARARVAELWNAAGLEVTESIRPPQRAPESTSASDLWPAALLALVFGIGLEWRLLAGWGAPSPFRIAGLFGLVFLTAVVSRRLRTGRWLSAQESLVDLTARDPQAPPAPATLWIVTRSDTPAPPSSEKLRHLAARLDWAWLALLILPGFYFGLREWLARSSPALMVGLAGLAILRRIDPWTRAPHPYPADNRTGLALVAELARTLGPSLRGRLDVRYALLATSTTQLGSSALRSHLAQANVSPGPFLILLIDAPGIGPSVDLAGRGPDYALGTAVARDLWLPITFRSGRVEPTSGTWTWFTLCGSIDPSATFNLPVLGAVAQWVNELARRFARQAGSGGALRDPSPSARTRTE
jgi:hypothetical protein